MKNAFSELKKFMVELRESLTPPPKVRAHIIVKGRIFEGSYHVFAEQKARDSGLKGWMKVRDGLSASAFIEVEVEGTEPKLKAYLTDLRTGNRDSNVSLVTVQWKAASNPPYTGFQRLL